ncbi:hypothetical protein B0H19DRAFT_1248744 [Mycena capillaripes]|nr:hypothetical protein B0H19DRAFT_1248744 [Mycena capillaripes]
MGRPSRRQVSSRRANQTRHLYDDPNSSGDEEDAPTVAADALISVPADKPRSLKVQIIEKDTRITKLEDIISGLETELLRLGNENRYLQLEHTSLLEKNKVVVLANKSLNSLKRKAESHYIEELRTRQKHIRRLEHDREVKAERQSTLISSLESDVDKETNCVRNLEFDLASVSTEIHSGKNLILRLKATLLDRQTTLTAVRNQLYSTQKQAHRAKTSLKEYTAVARELARNLTFAGCTAGKVEFAVRSCADAFGIKIRHRFMSRRTVGRAIDEGGKYREIQLAREILDAPGFIESSDGTTHRGITVESRHITLLVPSYDPSADESDTSTWKHHTRFVEVAPALDHTAQRQFDGTMEAASRITDTYARSPLATQENRTMESDNYLRKKLGEVRDHAADGKKALNISAERKTDVVIRDLGRAALDEDDLATSQILATMLSITDDDLKEAGNLSPEQLEALSAAERSKLTTQVLEHKIGQEKFDALSPEDQETRCMHVFGGCCCHKDLNVLRIAYAAVQRLYETHPQLTPPVLLANKANSATICLGADDPNSSAAVQNAIEASSSGAIKLLQLLRSLLRHKDGERGYQQRCTIFMRERQFELYGIENAEPFPDVSNTRYSSFNYGAAYVVCFHGLIQELLCETIDAKVKSGQPNHVEHLILKGLNCAETMSHLVAIALYGVSVGWSYMAMVRGPVNLLSLTPLHRQLPEFCANLAANPWKILDPSTPLAQLTINGKPFRDPFLLDCVHELRPSLPNLFLIISTLFSGAETGWIRFTPEFQVGGTFDRLTPNQRALLGYIPATNDHNEGKLGGYRNHMKYHPNSTVHSYSNETRVRDNNTEAFIKKYCDKAVEKFVMREVRRDGASGRRAKFRQLWVALQSEKAEKGLRRREAAAAKKKTKASRLAATTLEFDITKIRAMTSKLLKDQLAVYRDVLKDEVLVSKLWKEMTTVAVRRDLVLQARERELAWHAVSDSQDSNMSEPAGEIIITDEYGYVAGDDDDWEEIVE